MSRKPVAIVDLNESQSSRATCRDISGKSTVATATEKMPCGSM